MKNKVEAQIEFSYQGEIYTPMTTIDLDVLMQTHGSLPDFHNILARENQIDSYSYLYEIMDSYDVVFSNATGIASECLTEGKFDKIKFETLWYEQQIMERLRKIAQKHLQIEDLDQHANIKSALLEAYQVGRDAKTKSKD